ncbi:MAG: GNAT family N-acetyltransferase [Mobilitalea sp.]
MNVLKATINDFEIIFDIVHRTIKHVYPNYYPTEVVDFFLEHHNKEHIMKDLDKGMIYLLSVANKIVGTGSIDGRYIGRVYVLPEYQGKGYGSTIMSVLEEKIAQEFNTSFLDASLPSYAFYLKHGYQPTEYLQYEVTNHRMLCYYSMEKTILFN